MPLISRRRFAGLVLAAALVLGPSAHVLAGSNATPDVAAPADANADAMPASGDMDPAKTIVENLKNAPNFTTLTAALKATGLDATLSGPGPYILFAPDDSAFAKLPKETLDSLMQPENKDKLSKILRYHVVPGKLTEDDIEKLGGITMTVPLRSVEGGGFIIKSANGAWQITDESGGTSIVTKPDVHQSNGSIYVIDTVLMPKM